LTAPTIKDVAREASVSVASVSRAMNGHSNVTETTRQRILEAARRLEYVPHSGARSLTMRHSNTIGVVLPDLFGEFFSEIIRGIDSAAHRRGLQLLLANMHGSADETVHAIRAMRGRVDGLLVMSAHIDSEFLSSNLPRGLPAVVMNGSIDGVGHASLSIDSFAGARMMVEHLVDQGFRNIAHIRGPDGNIDAEERLRGFRQAIQDLIGDEDPLVFDGDFAEESGRQAGRTLAANPGLVDAVFAGNDVMAVGCLSQLIDAGLSVPGDIAVAGFDDIPIARHVTPSLTTMQVHIAELGTMALETLLETIGSPESPARAPRTLTPELVVRQSTAKPR
jgi:LacI family transcriptional regulator